MEAGHTLSSELGRITISSDAIAHIVGETARECYGVVGMAARGPVGKLLARREHLTQGIQITRDAEGEGVTIDLHVIVEYGLNLAEVASTIRNRNCPSLHRAPAPARSGAMVPWNLSSGKGPEWHNRQSPRL